MSAAVTRVLSALDAHGCGPRRTKTGWEFKCPGHEDGKASGSLAEGESGRALIKCFAGCATEIVLGALGLNLSDLFEETARPARVEVCSYDYHDENGRLAYQVVRYNPKDFRQRRPHPDGGWVWGLSAGWYEQRRRDWYRVKLNGLHRRDLQPQPACTWFEEQHRVLYRLLEVIETVRNGGLVYKCEGEKDCDAVNAADPDHAGGFIATTNPGGAGKWRPEFSKVLGGARVCIVAHKDEAGRRDALDVGHHLKDIAASIEIREALTGNDAADHLEAGHALDDFRLVDFQTEPTSASHVYEIVDLHGADVVPVKPKFRVKNFVRKVGLGLAWAQPGGHKTSLTLRMFHELMIPGRTHLLGHPDMEILEPFGRVLFVTTEENTGELRYVADAVMRGLGDPTLAGHVHHLFAVAGGRPRVTLDDLPAIIETRGPFDAVVLDSLTGLRPKLVNGERPRYDQDNDIANEQCLVLRSLADQYQMLFWLIHHSDKMIQNYRGPVEWWASADMMFGLLAKDGRIKVHPQKVRGGRVLVDFLIEPVWEGDRLDFEYAGEAGDDKGELTPTAAKVLAFLQGRGEAPQYMIPDQIGASRSAVLVALKVLEEKKKAAKTGRTEKNSPVWTVSG